MTKAVEECAPSSVSTATRLDSLPAELIVTLSTYLTVSDVRRLLFLVCRRFHHILADERLYKARLLRRFPAVKYTPAYVGSESFLWSRCCDSVEKEHHRWVTSRPERSADNARSDYKLVGGHYACVDAVHLMDSQAGLICVSGSRDRGITVWNIQSMLDRTNSLNGDQDHDASDNNVCLKEQAHDGWIWHIGSHPHYRNQLYSTGWDCYVKQWALDGGAIQAVNKTKMTAAVVSLVVNDDWLAVGTYDRFINVIDTRAFNSNIARLTSHAGAVLSLAQTDDGTPYLYSSAEDRSVICTDTRMWATVQQRNLPQYATSVSYANKSLWASTCRGYLCLLDPHKPEMPSIVNLHVCNRRSITSVKHNLGSVLCVTADRYLHVYQPNQRIGTIKRFGRFSSDPTKLDYRKGVLACGFADGTVGIWSPPSVKQ